MGKERGGKREKQEEEPPSATKKAPLKTEDAVEDPPIIKQLKELDDQYLELERQYERECRKLLCQYMERQQPLLEERKKVLVSSHQEGDAAAASTTGTPALEGFWLKAMQNHPAFEDCVQKWDQPVLEYLADIEKSQIEEDEDVQGFKLCFRFAENPYFTNMELEKEYRMVTANPYCGEIEVKEIKCSTIQWKAGRDVTVEKVQRKAKVGSKKHKQKQRGGKEQEEPRPSFFRDFFRNLRPGMELTQDAQEQAMSLAEGDDESDLDDEDNLLAYLMEADHDMGTALRDNIIPFAVRWYTGEAAPDLDSDDDEESEEESEEEEEEEDGEESAEEGRCKDKAKAKAKGGASKEAAKKKKTGGKASPEVKPSDPPKEECKQQ